MPINVIQLIDRFSSPYNVWNILNADATLNLTAYAEYSPVYLSATFSMTFILAFALTTAVIVHTILHHGPRIYKAVLNVKVEADDIHGKLMRSYKEVPDWWYLVVFLTFGVLFAILPIELYKTGLPVWGYLISILLPALYVLPAAFIFAMTNQNIAINLIAELIPGYIFPGQPVPCMVCFSHFSMCPLALLFIERWECGMGPWVLMSGNSFSNVSQCKQSMNL